VRDKKKRTQKQIKLNDLKPAKDPKGGMLKGSPEWILKHLQLGQRPGSDGKTKPNSPL